MSVEDDSGDTTDCTMDTQVSFAHGLGGFFSKLGWSRGCCGVAVGVLRGGWHTLALRAHHLLPFRRKLPTHVFPASPSAPKT